MSEDESPSSQPKTPIDFVVDQLHQKLVPKPDKVRLRKALDTADAEPVGREKSDGFLKRATGH